MVSGAYYLKIVHVLVVSGGYYLKIVLGLLVPGGYYLKIVCGFVFLVCLQGYYKEGYVPEPCKSCPQNHTTSGVGASNLRDCHPLPGIVISIKTVIANYNYQ